MKYLALIFPIEATLIVSNVFIYNRNIRCPRNRKQCMATQMDFYTTKWIRDKRRVLNKVVGVALHVVPCSKTNKNQIGNECSGLRPINDTIGIGSQGDWVTILLLDDRRWLRNRYLRCNELVLIWPILWCQLIMVLPSWRQPFRNQEVSAVITCWCIKLIFRLPDDWCSNYMYKMIWVWTFSTIIHIYICMNELFHVISVIDQWCYVQWTWHVQR